MLNGMTHLWLLALTMSRAISINGRSYSGGLSLRCKLIGVAEANQGRQSSASLLTVAQLRAVPATAEEVGPPTLASMRRNSLGGYPSGVCR
jgi:hypothetical protein